ncbi:hypothetical protein SAMN04488519_107163 [Algoriphagus ornithinivorans]|uniref:Uncharacterized protein n=1 Tax=Algoriphagus ornithinivorans TaxID=226506 RepID=A0A1I5HNE1_9BACT|nr:hypothetical protein [Algoriphagus ornithinivorans]SFO49832.1 hypothetical protein SAMN04488519_107163 [Algoriphagus ornithinivorans]
MKLSILKTRILSLLALLLFCGVIFVSCGDKKEEKSENNTEQTEKMENPDDEPAITH